jgi:hypothetical protein
MGSFVFFLKKINNQVTVMPLREKNKYTCMEGFLHVYLFLSSEMVKLNLQFEKTQKLFVMVFWSFSIGFVVILKFFQGRLDNFKFLNITKKILLTRATHISAS